LSQLQFSDSKINLIRSFLSNKNFRVSVEGEICTPRKIQAGLPQVFVLFPTRYNLYINDTSEIPRIHLTLVAGDMNIYMQQTAKKAMLSESCNAASFQWSNFVSAGT